MNRPVHPLLLAVFPVLHMLAANVGEAYLSDVPRALATVLLGAVALFVASRLILGDRRAAALLASLAIGLFFVYGSLDSWAQQSLPEWFARAHQRNVLLVQIAVLLFAILVLRRLRDRDLRPATAVANTMALIPVAMAVGKIALAALHLGSGIFLVSTGDQARVVAPVQGLRLDRAAETLPDVYYIVLDAYARADVLRQLFGYDNSEFVEALRTRGFYVAPSSASNYLTTKLVLPAVFNLDYLDDLAEQLGPEARDQEPLFARVRSNRVVATFRAAGYRIVNVSAGISRYALGDADEYLDLESARPRLSRFETVLLSMTPAPWLAERFFPSDSPVEKHRERILYGLYALGKVAEDPGPKFVYAHVLSPHNPFVFGPQGRRPYLDFGLFGRHSSARYNRYIEAYAGQIYFLNQRVLKVVDEILERSERSPVIVIQGDHGLRLLLQREPEDTCLVESFAILNALRLPGAAGSKVIENGASISPVNTFRLLFDSYFGTRLGLLENRSYFAHRYGIYNFRDVTEAVDTCTPIPGVSFDPALR